MAPTAHDALLVVGEIIPNAKAANRSFDTPTTWADEQAAVGATFDASRPDARYRTETGLETTRDLGA